MKIKNDADKKNPLLLYRNKSTGDLMERRNINKTTNYIPENRMEQYLSEYYQYLYNVQNKESENYNSLIANSVNSNTRNIQNSKLNLMMSPIENIKKSSNNSVNNNNKILPDDLLIEYDNRKRLEELRNKYLSNSSLLFLRKKNEPKINYYYPKEEAKNNEKINKENYNNNININNINSINKDENKKEIDLKNVIFDLKFKYEKLQNEFKILTENKNKYKENNRNKKIRKEKDTPRNTYKNYLIEENNKLKKINDNYEIIMEMLISYINETNKLYFNLDQIEYFNLRQNIWNKDTNCINELSDFLEKCKNNLANISINSSFRNKSNKKNKNNLSKKESKQKSNKIKNKMRYTYSTISFNNKISDGFFDIKRNFKSKTLNKTKNEKLKKAKIIFIKKNKK